MRNRESVFTLSRPRAKLKAETLQSVPVFSFTVPLGGIQVTATLPAAYDVVFVPEQGTTQSPKTVLGCVAIPHPD